MEKIFQKVKKLANGDENFFRVFPMIFFVIWPNDNKMPIYVVGKKYGTTILKYCSQAHRNCALSLILKKTTPSWKKIIKIWKRLLESWKNTEKPGKNIST